MSSITQYGWNIHFEKSFIEYGSTDLLPARVISIQGFNHQVFTEKGIVSALVSGALLHSNETKDLPKVGDWVLIKEYDDQGIILHVLPRLTELSRKMPGRQSAIQVIASNVDYALIVQAMDRDFNIMRLQRYILQVLQCGINPIILLNKMELVSDPLQFETQVTDLGYSVPVIAISAVELDSVCSFQARILQPGKTYVLIGSSGVGKSTLLNALAGHYLQLEGEVSDANGKGRHTTTHRNLVVLQNGSIIIDTPGMREFGVALNASDTAASVHDGLEALMQSCKFANCTHMQEPGCAVLEALENGALPQEVYHSYIKLVKEQRRFQISIVERKRTNKKFGRIMKEVKTHRKNNKF